MSPLSKTFIAAIGVNFGKIGLLLSQHLVTLELFYDVFHQSTSHLRFTRVVYRDLENKDFRTIVKALIAEQRKFFKKEILYR